MNKRDYKALVAPSGVQRVLSPMSSGDPQEPVVRSVLEADVDNVHAILMSPHVIAGSMRVPFSGVQVTRERLAPKAGAYQMVTEIEGHVVGFGELLTEPNEPDSGTSVTSTWSPHMPIGLAAEWAEHFLRRSSSSVSIGSTSRAWGSSCSPTTPAAIKLYESLGFKVEGTMPQLGFGSGGWMDAHMMGLLRKPGSPD